MRQFDFKLVFPCFFLTLALLTVPALAADAYVFPDSYCRNCGAAGILDESRSAAPTCTSQGFAVYEKCACGLRFHGVRLPALGHMPGQVAFTSPPTCEGCGYRDLLCDRCNLPVGGIVEGVEYPTEVPPLGHDFLEVERRESTCVTAGLIEYSCTRCGQYSYDSISAALGHDWIEASRTDATVTAPGSIEYACTRCNETYTETVPQLPAPLPDPSPDDNLTLASLLQTLTEIFSMSCEWVGVVSSSVVSNPILLLGVIIGFIGTGAGLFRRLLNL